MKINKILITAIAGAFLLGSCSSDDDNYGNNNNPNPTPQGDYVDGMFILNEGGFMAGNASVSFVSDEGVLYNNIFSTVNERSLGDTGQDIKFYGDYAFIVVNNSHKVEVVNRYTFESVANINTGFDNPRYIAFSGSNAYVTNWGDPTDTTDDFVAVVNLNTNAITTTIAVAEGPEKIIEANGKLYVAHKGGYGYGNTLSVINPANNTLEQSIVVGDLPNSLVADGSKLYVLSEGMPSWAGAETGGELTILNLADNTVANIFNFGATEHPTNLTAQGAVLYYTIDAGIYSFHNNATALPNAPLFETTPQGVYGVYGMALNNEKIYIGDAGDYNSAGKVYVYSLTGTLEDEYTVGVIPSGFAFN